MSQKNFDLNNKILIYKLVVYSYNKMTEFKCEFCSKVYSTLPILQQHKKTAKFCIKIQEAQNKVNVQLNKHNCMYCKKNFTSSSRLQSHLNSCKDKLKEDIKLNDKYTFEEQINQYKNMINNLSQENNILTTENNLLKSQILKLEEINKALIDKLGTSTTNNITLSNNTIYAAQYNEFLQKIPYLTEDLANRSFGKIRFDELYNNEIEKMDEIFINKFVTNFKDYTFMSDISRGILIVKKENGEPDRIHSEEFVLNCFKLGKEELTRLFNALYNYNILQREEKQITDEEFGIYLEKITMLRKFVLEGKSNRVVKKTARYLEKHTKKLQAKNLNIKQNVLQNEIYYE
jgi:hypothetical protein